MKPAEHKVLSARSREAYWATAVRAYNGGGSNAGERALAAYLLAALDDLDAKDERIARLELALPLIDRMEEVFAAPSPGLMTLLKMEVAEFRKAFPRDEGGKG